MKKELRCVLAVWVAAGASTFPVCHGQELQTERAAISYSRDVRPILQTHCYGCHQGARDSGSYNMIRHNQLLAGGESGLAAVVPGRVDESYLVEMITPDNGHAAMPPGDTPLDDAEIQTICSWIEEGANDDSTPRQTFDRDHPPGYSRRPVVTSLAASPVEPLLACSGISEVLLIDAERGEATSRLIGMSPRIQSIAFSPDGTLLAVAAGMPGQFGELQVWNVRTGEQLLSKVITEDTLFGVSWSPDGRLVAVGGTDRVVRAFDVGTSEQVLFLNAHEDWVRDTAFSVDGSHLVSVSRDMSCKLTEVAEQRFVDNVTSITPGVLKGGIAAVVRHPHRDEVVIGGADGVAKVYRVFRQTKRVIGDDANLIRRMPAVTGRIESVDVTADGKRIAIGASLDGRGAIHVYSYEFDSSLPENIKAIMSKVVDGRTAEEIKALDDYSRQDVRQIAELVIGDSSIYAVAFNAEGNQLFAGGSDGLVRVIDSESGELLKTIDPVIEFMEQELASSDPAAVAIPNCWHFESDAISSQAEAALNSAGESFIELSVEPKSIHLIRPSDYVQLVVRGTTNFGRFVDVSEFVKFDGSPLVSIDDHLLIQPIAAGEGSVRMRVEDLQIEVPCHVGNLQDTAIDYLRDVAPILTRLGCNAGTCHGSAAGKNGFQLSLRGYDPLFDIRSLTDDMSARRINTAFPNQSLMLLKPTAGVPHQGGQVLKQGGKYYTVIRNWIEQGVKFDPESAAVEHLQIVPANPVLQTSGERQQLRVVATYTDGLTRDVTREAFVESSDNDVAVVDGKGRVTAGRRGESAILARYEGAYAATTLIVMGDRHGFVWQEPDCFNQIDELVAEKWRQVKINPSPLTDDYEFVRRIYLDLTGLPPTIDQVREFVAEPGETQTKRDRLIDSLIGSPAFVDHWTRRRADLLQVNRKFLGEAGAVSFYQWIRQTVESNMPYDQYAREIVTAAGSNRLSPAASYFKILRTPAAIMENTTHLFLATRFNCNKCHDHPFERWTQDQYYQTAAFFAQVGLTADPESRDQRIEGSAVEDSKPLYEIVADLPTGEMIHERTGSVAEPRFPFAAELNSPTSGNRREQFAAWLTSPGNPYFARSYVNRLWGYLLGRGLIEPIDDIRAGNPPGNPELLEYLTQQFIQSGFDVRQLIALICKSRTYQLSIATNEFNRDDRINYSHASARRLRAEVLFDAMHWCLDCQTKIPGQQPGTRAAALPDAGIGLPSGFLSTLGRPAGESVCECERSDELQLGSVLALVSGPDQARVISDPENALARLIAKTQDDRQLAEELYLRILNRPPTDAESHLVEETLDQIEKDHAALIAARDERIRWFELERQRLEQDRELAMAAAEEELHEIIQRIDPELPQREAAQQQRKAAAEQALQGFHDQYDANFNRWREWQLNQVHWHTFVPAVVRQTNEAKTRIMDDRSVFVLENKGPTITEVIADTDLAGITAIRLEVLVDGALPKGGPGLADNGNFVLSELQFSVASRSAPDDWRDVRFASATSDFDQGDYPVSRAIDGNLDNGNGQGWAVSPETGKLHWAVFELSIPIGFKSGTRLRFKLHQNYTFDNKHQLGRFRLSFACHDAPIGLGLPESWLAVLAADKSLWSSDEQAFLKALFLRSDPLLKFLENELNMAKVPLSIDARIVQSRQALSRASQPVAEDALLVQLHQDVDRSSEQLSRLRLTAVQDLAWALFNSPSFLFNR